MPEGNFFADPKDVARARSGDAGDGGRDPRGVPPGRVLEGVRTRQPSGLGVAPAALRMPKTISEYVGVVRRRWRLIAAAAALSAAVAAVVTWQLPTRYRAGAIVLLDTRDVQVSDIKALVPTRSFDAATIRGEMEVLRSRALAERVVAKVRLDEQPDFAGVEASAHDAGDPQRRIQRAADTVLSRLTVENDGGSFVLKIGVTAGSPRLAAAIANAYADSYLEHQIAAKEEATQRANEWLKKEIATLREQIAETDERVSRYKEEHGITSARGATVIGQELADINTQLIAAHSDRVQKEAALRYAKQVLASPGGAEAAGQVLASPLIQRLREQEADLMQRMAEMSMRYRPAHPVMIRMKAELDDLRRKVGDEASRMVRAMAEEASAARTREEALKANLAELAQSTARQEGAQIELRELEREAEASRTLYENLLTRFKQTSAQQDILLPDAQIVSRAEAAASQPWPNKRRLLAGWAGLSLVLGVFLAFAIELFDPSFRHSEEIEDRAGLPVLGVLPTTELRRPHGKPPEAAEAILSEALRGIRSGLRQAQAGVPTGVLLVTSSVEGEGKTFFAVALGRSVVRARLRCLVIDCNFQRPGVDKLLSPAPTHGVLTPAHATGRYPQVEVDKESGLHYIPAPPAEQRRLFRSQDLFESAEMRNYVQRMRSHYDLVILDAPPLPAAADVMALSALANTVVLLVRWGWTPRQVALNALRVLARRSANIAGIVLSRVDLRRYATYGGGDYVRYLQDATAPTLRR